MWCTGRKLSKWIDIRIENPFKTWWKARKYFKRPKLCFSTFTSSFRSHKKGGRLLEIDCMDVIWKDKFNSPRHEISPYISILLFGKFGIRIDTAIYYGDEFGDRQRGDMEYWEYLLEWLYYKEQKTLKCYSGWSTQSRLYSRVVQWAEVAIDDVVEPYPYVVPCVSMFLNKRGIKELKRELNEEGGNTSGYQIFSCEPGFLWPATNSSDKR